MGRTHSTFTVVLVATVILLDPSLGSADTSKSGPVPAPEPARPPPAPAVDACAYTGTARLGTDVVVYDRTEGGRPIAQFTGATTPLRIGPYPTTSPARSPIATGTGSGAFRIDGYVDASEVPLFTTRDVPIAADHFWIAAQQAVVFVAATSGKLQVRKDLSRPLSQSFKAQASCDAFSLMRGTPAVWSVPGEARGYLVQEDPADLFATPDANQVPVTSLTGARGVLLWSEKKRGGFVHLVYHGEVVIDAWGRQRDFRALPPGETSDRLLPSLTVPNPPSLKLAEAPSRVVRATREVTLRSGGNKSAPVIGRIESGAETYVLDVIAGWATVLPKSLNVAPYGDGLFWAKASDLGL